MAGQGKANTGAPPFFDTKVCSRKKIHGPLYDTYMISERKFASAYPSFWRVALPLGEAYVRHINARITSYLPSRQIKVAADRSALISELGFRCYAHWASSSR